MNMLCTVFAQLIIVPITDNLCYVWYKKNCENIFLILVCSSTESDVSNLPIYWGGDLSTLSLHSQNQGQELVQ